MSLQKTLFTALLITTTLFTFAQQKDTLKYYIDEDGQPEEKLHAPYLIKVYKENPANQLWKRDYMTNADHKLLSTGYCKDSLGKIRQGKFIFFDYKGNVDRTGIYQDNKKDGEWLGYFTSGKRSSDYHLTLNKMTGLCRGWYENGNLSDSFNLDNNGNGYGIGLYESGQKRYEGFFAEGVKKGEWKYYYDLPGVKQSMSCVFEKDSLVSSSCFTKEGQLQTENCYYAREAGFIGGNDAWVKYLVKTISKSKYTRYMKSGEQYTVVVSFVLDEEGTVSDATVEEPGSKEKLDNIAEDIIRQSPHWQPAIQYNQPVKAYRRQPVTFVVN